MQPGLRTERPLAVSSRPLQPKRELAGDRWQWARALVRAVLQVAGPTVTPAPLPLAWQAGRRQFGLDRGRPQHWKLEILQGPSAPRAGHGI
jgi:hypothetical protein